MTEGMDVDFRTLHAFIDAELPERGFVENVVRLNLHEDAVLNRLLAGNPDACDEPLHALGGLPGRVSLTVLLAYALRVEPNSRSVDGSVINPGLANALVSTGQSLWLTVDRHEVHVATEPTRWVSNPQYFDVSWLDADELAAVCAQLPVASPQLHAPTRAALAAMREFDTSGYRSRLVFWFS